MRAFILLSILLINPIVSFAQEGGCGGHGGDAISQEAFQLSKSLVQRIRKLSTDQLDSISIPFKTALLEIVVQRTEINTVSERLYRGTKEVDAKNFGEQSKPEIKINRDRWLSYKNQPTLKEGIMLHEYLGILKSLFPNTGEWDTYELSTQILALLSQQKISLSSKNAATSQRLREIFLASTNSILALKPTLTYSCVEYSLLSNAIAPLAQKNAYTRINSQRSNSFEKQTNDKYINEFRLDSVGNLLVLKTSIEANRETSISFCPTLGSEAIQMLRFMTETTLPYFDLPQSEDYARYKREISELGHGKTYEKCVAEKNQDACMKIVLKLSNIRLPSEKSVSERYKTNITQINQWLDSLGANGELVNKPFLAVSAATARQMNYALALLNLGDDPNAADSGIRNFIESLETRLPTAFETAKATLRSDITQIEIEYIESFEP